MSLCISFNSSKLYKRIAVDLKPEIIPKDSSFAFLSVGRSFLSPGLFPSRCCFYRRETPTSAGPNSFGKTKIGFCDSKKRRDKDLEEGVADD